MPLRIRLSPNERFIVNGAVLINGDKRNTITVANAANVLRERDVILAANATTPATKAYFLVQSLLLTSGADKVDIGKKITASLAHLYTLFASDDARANIMEAVNQFSAQDLYKSLAALKEVVACERALESAKEKEDNNVDDDGPSDSTGYVR